MFHHGFDGVQGVEADKRKVAAGEAQARRGIGDEHVLVIMKDDSICKARWHAPAWARSMKMTRFPDWRRLRADCGNQLAERNTTFAWPIGVRYDDVRVLV